MNIYERLPAYGRKIREEILTLEELNDLDAFNVMDCMDEFMAYRTERPVMPPLPEGVFKSYTQGIPIYVRWRVFDRESWYFRISVYAIDPNGQARFLHSQLIENDVRREITTASDVVKRAMPKLLEKERKELRVLLPVFEEFNEASFNKMGSYVAGMFLSGMAWFDELLNKEEERLPSESERKAIHYGFKKVGGDRRRVIYLNGAKVECGRNTQISVRKGYITRKTDCWGVRGHYRHYQNGKVIYIEPFEKGVNRNAGKKKGKEYKVKV